MKSAAALVRESRSAWRAVTRLMVGLFAYVGAIAVVLAAADPPANPVSGWSSQSAPAGLQSAPPAQPVSAPVTQEAGSQVSAGQVTQDAAPKAGVSSPAATAADHEVEKASTDARAAEPADADSDLALLEKQLHSHGYKTRMQNGEKMFCRREEVLGTRLGGALHCMTVAEERVHEKQLEQEEEQARQQLMRLCIMGGTGKVNCGNTPEGRGR